MKKIWFNCILAFIMAFAICAIVLIGASGMLVSANLAHAEDLIIEEEGDIRGGESPQNIGDFGSDLVNLNIQSNFDELKNKKYIYNKQYFIKNPSAEENIRGQTHNKTEWTICVANLPWQIWSTC